MHLIIMTRLNLIVMQFILKHNLYLKLEILPFDKFRLALSDFRTQFTDHYISTDIRMTASQGEENFRKTIHGFQLHRKLAVSLMSVSRLKDQQLGMAARRIGADAVRRGAMTTLEKH
ncbi:hypothetical protein CO674_10610 [Rhizobium hidalgonense]|uniref:Uncharacterized protein n=2 Tax=Rhizobium hidalgonense TaxID=1538159 RepID=A0ABX4JTK9_9HYPH|nr:hypothetical protein CO674_10610 [Rhizobium hidalgonense]PON03530.1 hypothetical protein ATY29_30740 [Rhizobium hidalgonense]